jgi:hypothetical protein
MKFPSNPWLTAMAALRKLVPLRFGIEFCCETAQKIVDTGGTKGG